ncbi:MAG TPA: GNAT family protein [Pseudomonadales bacterium]|nr:GNAT family protein [Pseudomonadales bacterium]
MIHTMYFSKSINPSANCAVGEFVCNGADITIKDFCSTGIFHDGQLIGGVLYHNYYDDSGVVELSAYASSKKWLTKASINAIFFLPFERLSCQMIVLRVSERNKVMRSIAERLGFKGVYVPRLRGREEGEHIFSLTDDDWQSSKYYGDIA